MVRKITMPFSSAGILGIGSNMELDGIKITPQFVFGVVLVFILIVKVADKLFLK